MDKNKIIRKAYKEGKIKKLGNSCYSVPSEFFILGITPRRVDKKIKTEAKKMDRDKTRELYKIYQNGNISDFKEKLNKLTKKELLDFCCYVNDFDDVFYICSKYLENDKEIECKGGE